jgi:AcrR family transcriptional regulator
MVMDGTPPDALHSGRRRRQPPAERRQDILAAAVKCLARLGPRGATGREICREAGVSHGLLRHYFDNPDNLLLETYQTLCDQCLDAIEADMAPFADAPWEAIQRIFGELIADRWASPDVLGAWTAFWTLVGTHEEFAAVSAGFYQRLRGLLERAANQLPETERTAMPIEDAIVILLAMMDGLWLEFCLAPQRTSRERAVELFGIAARRILGR